MGISHPVDTHVDYDSVMCLEDLSAHRTGSLSSRDSWNLVGHLSNFPGMWLSLAGLHHKEGLTPVA